MTFSEPTESASTVEWSGWDYTATAADAAAVAAQIPVTLNRVDERQAQSAAFITEWGASVLDGHTVVDDVPPGDSTPMSGQIFNPTAD
jgi:hypothetical protein